MASEFQVSGKNAAALFTLKVHRGDGMALLAMNWKKGKPPLDFVGFAIEYKEPAGTKFLVLKTAWASVVPAAASIRTRCPPASRRSRNSAGCIFPATLRSRGHFSTG
jgi:hypothetical protein